MTSFKFPPPPPPPPKSLSNADQQAYPSQRGGYNKGRGDGGRGRGGSSRGGAGSFGGNSRGGQGHVHSGRGNAHSRGGPRGGYQNNRDQYNRGETPQRGGPGFVQRQWQQPAVPAQTGTPNTPNIAYANPSFANPPPVDPNSLVQAMSFMATPAGAQTMAAFASHMASASNPSFTQPLSPQNAQHVPRYSPTQQSGQKRKWDERQNTTHTQPQFHSQGKPQQQGSKPPRAKAAVAPAIPTFGFTLPTPLSKQSSTSSKADRMKDNKKGRIRLGLTHEPAPDESSEEEDIDEEVALGTRLKGGGYAFEHQGEHISLQTAGDIAEWIKDRRRNFPTYQKAVEKAEAAAKKRKNELDFVRKLKGKPPQPEIATKKADVPPQIQGRSKREEKKQEELATLRKKLHESMLKKKGPAAAVDLGLGYGSATESDEEESSVLSDSSVISSSEESSGDSDAESDDSNAAPEPTSSKIAPPRIHVPPAVTAQTERRPDKEKICNSWRQHGKCSFGHSCKFKHPPKEETRTGLYEKLVEQELVKADQLALDAIKYLGQHGFLG